MKRDLISKEQNKSKPMIEDVIPSYLYGDIRKNALSFCKYLGSNKIKLVWAGTNTWKAAYKR